jgi:hypothetical protein
LPCPYVPRHQAQSILKTQVFKKSAKGILQQKKKTLLKKIQSNDLKAKNASF